MYHILACSAAIHVATSCMETTPFHEIEKGREKGEGSEERVGVIKRWWVDLL